VKAYEICCRKCRKNLHPDPKPLPDDEFWSSGAGDFVHAIKLIVTVLTGMALILVGIVKLFSLWTR
jgi:hypothetical protein